MPTIRFENTDESYKKSAGDLLKSLQLDPERWLEDQEFELTSKTKVEVFGMRVPVPAALTNEKHWSCRIVEQNGSRRLLVGEVLWAARVAKDAVLEDSVAALPEDLVMLSLAGLLIENVDFVTKLTELECLDLGACTTLTDLNALSGLTQLSYLNLWLCKSLTDISALADLTQLSYLDLQFCSFLSDIRPLSGLGHLNSLNLSGVHGIHDFSDLSGLDQLEVLVLCLGESRTDTDNIPKLSKLTSLTLTSCASLTDISSLSGLSQITELNLRGCRSLMNINALSAMPKLDTLELYACHSLADISALSGLSQLTSLHLVSCNSLTDISVLEGMPQLSSLNLGGKLLNDITALYGCKQLSSLDLCGCKALSELSSLSGLAKLSSLNLRECTSLTDLSDLSGLTALTSLNLSSCEGVMSLNALSTCHHLDTLILSGCTRLTSIEPVREIAVLRKLTGFNPDQAAELLAHTAVLRKDGAYIDEHASAWLRQIQQMDEAAPEERERFATTLGEALSLLGESPHEETYEAYLASRPEFSASPWKAWFAGTREVSGWELMRVRVERQELANANPGCIGGVCASLSDDDDVSGDERPWALDWLGRMEQVWAERGKELLPVAAEVCVAHLRHGLDDPLERWLLRLTDESDPASMDPVQAALGRWQLKLGNLDAARDHAAKIETPDRRDPLLLELAKRYVAVDPQAAGELLLAISSPQVSRELVRSLSKELNFVSEAANIERLVVACGDSPETLAELIDNLPPETDPTLLEELSKSMREKGQEHREM